MRKNLLLKIGLPCMMQFMFSFLSFAQYVNPANQLYGSPGDYITNVSFNTINNSSTVSTSGAAALFGDYTSISTTVNPSATYSLSISTFWSEYPGDKLYVYVFFDWNHNYDFTDANEYYIVANGIASTGTGGHVYNLTTKSITIPSDASLSNIRMRVRLVAISNDPGLIEMQNFSGGMYGEIEDYTINVAAPASVPTVTSISPTSGSTAGGNSVVITGTNFTGASAVKFGSTNATGFTVNSSTQITATSPAKSAGAVDITVTTAGGTSATSGFDQFTYVAAPDAPTIGIASVGNAQASVAFTAPVSNGGSAITGYTATSSPGGFTGTGTSSPITVLGLTNGTAYTFTVTATNIAGTSAASASSNSVTPSVSTGLNNPTSESLTFYPNPATDGFSINVGEKTTLVSIYDFSGSLVLTQQSKGDSYINISSLQKGIYVVKANGLVGKLAKK